ncbi:MAG: DUF2461 domain-containing protein [Prevotellaceae bacterium]|jgi:uncharacterized protein (TIGR02453 family)|nr:DUF2461 domain-containing protein [Prevotellaceae bacterium]
MNSPLIFDFLKSLSAHNDREWFKANRDRYDAASAEFEQFVQESILTIAEFDDSVKELRPKDCIYRIYRDIRFSTDKTPYKQHFGAYINPKGKKSQHGGYYIHVQPDNSLLSGGAWNPSPKLLHLLRQAVYENIDEFRAIVEDPAFTRYFPTIGDTRIKTIPKGFPKDFPYITYLQPKDYCATRFVPDTFFSDRDVQQNLAATCRQMKRFLDFVNYTIDDYEENE